MTETTYSVDMICRESYPCQHTVTRTTNGAHTTEILSAPDLLELLVGSGTKLSVEEFEHFKYIYTDPKYVDKNFYNVLNN
jgi:hypothetical protein